MLSRGNGDHGLVFRWGVRLGPPIFKRTPWLYYAEKVVLHGNRDRIPGYHHAATSRRRLGQGQVCVHSGASPCLNGSG